MSSAIDLRGKKSAWRDVKRQAESEIQAPVESDESVGVEPVSKSKGVPRKLAFPIEYLCPETGNVLVGEVVSEVPDKPGRDKIAALVSARGRNRPWVSIHPNEQARILSLSQCEVQIIDAPDWFAKYVGMDDFLLFQVTEGLTAHVDSHFRGYARKGPKGENLPRLVVGVPPALREALSSWDAKD